MRRPAEFEAFPDALCPGFGPYRAICRHVVDGDTIDALTDLGCNDYRYLTCRLMGIDTPEVWRKVSRDAGIAAREYLRAMVPVGAQVQLHTEPDPDSFGRYVAAVIYARMGELRCANVDLVRAGHAVIRADWGWHDVLAVCGQRGIDTTAQGAGEDKQ